MRTEKLGHVIALGLIALILVAGLCQLNSDHESGGELCASFLALTSALLLALPLMPRDRLLPVLAAAHRRDPSDLPPPPPKT